MLEVLCTLAEIVRNHATHKHVTGVLAYVDRVEFNRGCLYGWLHF